MMTECDRLKAENYALRQRSEALDVALGGYFAAAQGALSILKMLSERFADDADALAAINEGARKWSDLSDEIVSRTKAFVPLVGSSRSN